MDDLADVIINLFTQLDKHFLPIFAKKIKAVWYKFRDDFFTEVEKHHITVISKLDNDITSISTNIDLLKSLPANELVASKITKLNQDLTLLAAERNKNAQLIAKLQAAHSINLPADATTKKGLF